MPWRRRDAELPPLLRLDRLVAGHLHPVTRPIDLELGRGEIIGLFGPNGVGKSTLLATLLGTARIHAGELWRADGLRLRYLPQRPERPGDAPISGHEFLAWLDARRLDPPQRLAACLDRRIDHLSGGEFQLLCLWATLAGDADLVLLDEPTNHLDCAHVELAAEELAAGQEQRGTLLVSHDIEFLHRVSTHLVHLQ